MRFQMLKTFKFKKNYSNFSNLQVAIMDNATRWSSTFNMLNRLLEMRDVLNALEAEFKTRDFTLLNYEWKQIEKLAKILEKPAVATQQFQSQDLTPGNFIYIWEILKEELVSGEFKTSDFGKSIRDSMVHRESLLFDNPFFCAAVFVDVQYQCLLREEQQVFILVFNLSFF